MKAKRLAALILALALALALSGCGDDGWYEPKDSASYYVEGQDELLARLRELGYKVVTQLRPAGAFYEAEAYHQRFAERTGRGACHLAVPRFERRADGSPVE